MTELVLLILDLRRGRADAPCCEPARRQVIAAVQAQPGEGRRCTSAASRRSARPGCSSTCASMSSRCLFVIFDVELAFFFPWAVVFGGATATRTITRRSRRAEAGSRCSGKPVERGDRLRTSARRSRWRRLAFADILVFFGVLLVGFAYLWKRGDLEWVRSTASQDEPSAGNRGRLTWALLEGRMEEGFVVTNLEFAINWARAIAAVADDVRPGLLRHRDDGRPARRATTSTASAPARSAPRRDRRT